jgi:hypothetical protein
MVLGALRPALFVHASDDSTEMAFRATYRAFVDAFRTGVLRLRQPPFRPKRTSRWKHQPAHLRTADHVRVPQRLVRRRSSC